MHGLFHCVCCVPTAAPNAATTAKNDGVSRHVRRVIALFVDPVLVWSLLTCKRKVFCGTVVCALLLFVPCMANQPSNAPSLFSSTGSCTARKGAQSTLCVSWTVTMMTCLLPVCPCCCSCRCHPLTQVRALCCRDCWLEHPCLLWFVLMVAPVPVAIAPNTRA